MVFSIVFWKFLWGDKALMEEDKVVMRDPPIPPLVKTLALVRDL